MKRSLSSSSLRKKYAQLTDERVATFLERIVAAGTLSQNPPAVFSLRRDPADEPYLNLAIEMHVSFLVSRDKDLLDLMKDDAFRTAYPKLAIVDPATFLRHVRSSVAKELGYE